MNKASFYHFILNERGAKNEYSIFAEAVFNDLMFPKYTSDFHVISTYIEEYGSGDMSLSIFDQLYEKYTEWQKF
ncbi:YozE family protein [Macrococcus armenti]|uniref:YozE family protein n=1 Tax=Macrococcus armenti TaxID=2875764 RepID=UPI001CCA0525|nr:YozE family protein [Macrococcus armenti]UBH07577.1 YozE family protein [Macrococcus armenti]UBH09810.1 YozE family protein [Macrococcus armenti]